MTTWDDISNRLDVMLASYENGVNLDEYEKSVYFNKAHRDLIREYYSRMYSTSTGYGTTEEIRSYLFPYIEEYEEDLTDTSGEQIVSLRPDILYILREEFTIQGSNTKYPVVPVSQDEVDRIRNNPFKNTRTQRRVLKIDSGYGTAKLIWWTLTDLITYSYCYIKDPGDLGYKDPTTLIPELSYDINPIFLELILQRVVDLVFRSRIPIKPNV